MSTLGALGSAFVSGQRASLEQKGDQLLFYVKALAWTPRAIRRYPREIVNTLAEVTFGAGGLTLIAGTVGVIAFLAFFAGTEVGIQGYASLSQLGVAKFSAFISAYFNTREVAPLISSIALAATVGGGGHLGEVNVSRCDPGAIRKLRVSAPERRQARFQRRSPCRVRERVCPGSRMSLMQGGAPFATTLISRCPH